MTSAYANETFNASTDSITADSEISALADRRSKLLLINGSVQVNHVCIRMCRPAYEAFYIGASQAGRGASNCQPLDVTSHNNGMLVVVMPKTLSGNHPKIYVRANHLEAFFAGSSQDWRGTPTLRRLETVEMPDNSKAIFLPPSPNGDVRLVLVRSNQMPAEEKVDGCGENRCGLCKPASLTLATVS